ncbi:MAG: hypothetical protein JWO79_16 [Actinomycetia bacterium]|nr:hypothetical protein [Actinomycetes bacterium]
MLADIHRLAGRSRQSLEVSLDGLRGHTWAVLLQSGAAAATQAARYAAGDAIDLARAYLAANDPAGAAVALDAGRGLVLQAAMRFGEVPERLTRIGEDDLAERWREAAAQGADRVPTALRREVITRIAAGGTTDRPAPLDPPDGYEVRAALAKAGADALVYLLPADATGPGTAIVLPADDDASHLPLRGLDLRATPAWQAYTAIEVTRSTRSSVRDVAAGHRDLAPDEDPDADADAAGLRTALREVGEWAWDAAVGPVLEHLAELVPADRPPRIVLVAMGELARVPWHAALPERFRAQALRRGGRGVLLRGVGADVLRPRVGAG